MDSSSCSFAQWLKQQKVNELSEISDQGSTIGINPELLELAKAELKRMVKSPENIEPDRGDLDDPEIVWRSGKPNYTLANLAFLKGKCMSHQLGSLELIVQNAVKKWEMEASHKIDTSQWRTIEHEKYNVQANNNKKFYLKEAAERGNYNVLMHDVDKSLFDAESESFESSHHLFQKSFESSFPWEVLQVFAGPPNIVFSWRHWGEFTGEYKGNKGQGELLQMTGFARVTVTEALKITDIKVFYKPENFLAALQDKPVQESNEEVREDTRRLLDNTLLSASSKLTANGQELDENSTEIISNLTVTEVFSGGSEVAFSWSHLNDGEDLKGFAILYCSGNSEVTCGEVFYKSNAV